MRNILVTGGTVFVSRYVAAYFVRRGDRVYVLNRGTKPQPAGVTLIPADRHALGDALKSMHFDAVLDVTAYTRADVADLVEALGSFGDYIFVSSSAVYPETLPQPFRESNLCGPNALWGDYGIHKLEAEDYLTKAIPRAYILRPPYLYGPGENIHRSPFVFDCAEGGRPFFLPPGELHLQFFHVEDLCRMMELLLEQHPQQHIYNVGNPEAVTAAEWVKLCYEVVGAPLVTRTAPQSHAQRCYFPFPDYNYFLDVSAQQALMPQVKSLGEGLAEEYTWFQSHRSEINRRPYTQYMDAYF